MSARPVPATGLASTVMVDIAEIGARGDGIARTQTGPVFVPYTVPGDRVAVYLGARRGRGADARIARFLRLGPERAEPSCRHFQVCGGCTLQHVERTAYIGWKRELVCAAFARCRLPTNIVQPLRMTQPGRRRRADFTAFRRRRDIRIGFNERGTHRVVDLTECRVILPEIYALLAPLRALLRTLLASAEAAEVVVNRTDSGLDVLLVMSASLALETREQLADFAHTHDLARLCCRHPGQRTFELIVERRPVRVIFGGIPVTIPPAHSFRRVPRARRFSQAKSMRPWRAPRISPTCSRVAARLPLPSAAARRFTRSTLRRLTSVPSRPPRAGNTFQASPSRPAISRDGRSPRINSWATMRCCSIRPAQGPEHRPQSWRGRACPSLSGCRATRRPSPGTLACWSTVAIGSIAWCRSTSSCGHPTWRSWAFSESSAVGVLTLEPEGRNLEDAAWRAQRGEIPQQRFQLVPECGGWGRELEGLRQGGVQ